MGDTNGRRRMKRDTILKLLTGLALLTTAIMTAGVFGGPPTGISGI